MIPLNKDEHEYNTRSYGCHEYYHQGNDFEQKQIVRLIKIKIKIERSELMRDLVIWLTHRWLLTL